MAYWHGRFRAGMQKGMIPASGGDPWVDLYCTYENKLFILIYSTAGVDPCQVVAVPMARAEGRFKVAF